MLIDARTLEPGSTLDADVAVVGGGLAGLTLAKELAASGRLRIVVLESGGREIEAANEDLNRGTGRIHDAFGNVRAFDEYLHESRCRCLGGSGVLWGGKCAELDPIDFEPRKWIEHSGWPFDYEHLKPYLNRACHVMELPVFHRNAPIAAPDARAPLLINREMTITTGLRRHSAITGRATQNQFERFVTHVVSLPSLSVYLYATVAGISVDNGAVTALQVTSSQQTLFAVRARSYVLAAGGLENARLLLTMRGTRDHDLIGRFFMGHVIYRQTHAGHSHNHLVPRIDSARLALYVDKDPTQLQGVFQLTRNAQKRERLPNCSLTLEPPAMPGEALPVYFMLEQRPHRASRLTLSDERDATGMPRLHLDWHFQEQDFLDLRRVMERFADELKRHEIGELSYETDPGSMIHYMETVRHHLGTTRMHTRPEEGVVNENCRAHEFSNLYVTGASVFPTSGISNPTLSILALALRLADHLADHVFRLKPA